MNETKKKTENILVIYQGLVLTLIVFIAFIYFGWLSLNTLFASENTDNDKGFGKTLTPSPSLSIDALNAVMDRTKKL